MAAGVLSLAIGWATQTLAAGAPAAAMNKTVKISFAVNGTSIRPGEQQEHSYSTIVSELVYVSSAGRLFTRHQSASAGQRARSKQSEQGPDGGSGQFNFHFQGNSLIGQMTFASGARLINATFDPSFTSCTVAVRDGRENGASIKRRGPTGALNQIVSSTISSPSCSIQEGNAFAG